MIKQLEEIARVDFEVSPYWMFYSGPGDEHDSKTTLISQAHPAYDNTRARLIRTTYTLYSGLILDGFLYEDPPEFKRHTIFVKNTGFETWFGIFPPARSFISFIYDMLQLRGQDVFPISWETFGKEYSGTIDGFGYLENGVDADII